MFDVVDYLGASEATRRRIEEMVTANLSGKAGSNIHLDKLCEHFIRQVKEILMRLHRGFDDNMVAMAVASSNPIRIMLEHEYKGLGLEQLLGGGDHARSIFSDVEKATVSREISRLQPFSSSREISTFNQLSPTMFEYTPEEFRELLSNKGSLYKEYRTK